MRKKSINLTEAQRSELIEYQSKKSCKKDELRRISAILLLDASQSALVQDITGFTANYAFTLRKKFLECGIDALKDKTREARALLTRGQRVEIIKIITTSSPRVFGYAADYWNVFILAALIKEQYNVQYKSRKPFYLLFKGATFTYHKPDKQYKPRDQAVIDAWLKTKGREIEKLAAEENTVIVVEDEMILTTQTTTQKVWLPRGEFPKIDVSVKRERRCIYGFLNVQTGHQHALKTLRASSEDSINALNMLGNLYKNKKIVLIWDNASWHKSAEIKKFLSATKHNFHLINFPPYAPDLNPQENVWKAGRAKVTHNTFIENIDKATDQFVQFLNDTFFEYKFTPLVVS